MINDTDTDQSTTLPVVLLDDSFIDYPGMTSLVVFTHGCNLHCNFCFVWDTINDKSTMFRKYHVADIATLLIEEQDYYGALVLSGGEPTLHPVPVRELLERVRRGSPTTKTRILTNGTNCDFLSDLVDDGLLDSVLFSIKHPSDIISSYPGIDYIQVLNDMFVFSGLNRDRLAIEWVCVKTPSIDDFCTGFLRKLAAEFIIPLHMVDDER